ncbi:MAG: cobyric acid synthase, partial [Candidatus Rokuibacteriota bacterium]
LLPAEDRARVAGFVVNKFRGDSALLAPGFDELTARTGVPVLGVVPYIAESLVPAEDSLNLEDFERARGPAILELAVARLPRIANFDDLEPLVREPGVRVRFARRPGEFRNADLIVLPGSKNTAEDLAWLRAGGLADEITSAAIAGRPVVGICGGYQMLGLAIHDPEHVESPVTTTPGLGLLPVVTRLERDKTTVRVRGRVRGESGPFAGAAGTRIEAYEIHVGRTEVSAGRQPFHVVRRGGASVDEPDGALNDGGNVVGTYLHGLFANDPLRRALLVHLASRRGVPPDPGWGTASAATTRYDRLADIVGASCDLAAIGKLVGLGLVMGAVSLPGGKRE